MNAKAFLDANIIIYAFSSNDPRRDKAEALLHAGDIISVQVLNEFVNVSRRKIHRDWDEIQDALTILRALLDPPQPLTIDTHEVAIGVAREYGFGFYDALVVAAALRAGCPMLYSEDLHAGQVIERLTIHNPFVD